MAKTKNGICKLCGKDTSLTFEHVPPRTAFNTFPVKEFSTDETIKMMTGVDGRLPWDFSGLPSVTNQRGGGDYYLCSECNTKTGAWYISEYVKLANTFHYLIVTQNFNVGKEYSFHISGAYPLRILKAIMTMYCDINYGCMGDEQLREFLINKDSANFDLKKYSLSICMVSPNMRRVSSLTSINFTDVGTVIISEIGSYPIGTILCLDKPDSYNPPGLSISSFAKYEYEDKCDIDFCGIPYLEINSLFPIDFRSKEDFNNFTDCL